MKILFIFTIFFSTEPTAYCLMKPYDNIKTTPARKCVMAILCIVLLSCNQNNSVDYSYYYWKTNLSLTIEENKALQQATDEHLYVRYFDIDKTDTVFFPVAVLTKDSAFETTKKIVPVVYITNRSFINTTTQQISFLATSISNHIDKLSKQLQLNTNNEIQIDCDWTQTTRDNYFLFLNELKKESNKQITSTLRLHQVKDKAIMGIPPVEKVYLMCYATSSPLETDNRNSILDVNTLKNYLADLQKYPLKTSIALPIYSWAIVTNHIGKHKLINGITINDLKNSNFKQITAYEFEVVNEGFYFDAYLSKGFKLKVEEITEDQLKQTLSFINTKIKNYTIVYYHLDEHFIANRNF